MSADTIWRWFCSLNESELADSSGEPILELRPHADPARDFEPVLADDWDEDEAPPDITLH